MTVPTDDVTESPWFLPRLGEFMPLTANEQAALTALAGAPQTIPARQYLCEEGLSKSKMYVVHSGFLASLMTLASGQRQMIKLSMAGDIVGTAGIALETAPYSAQALSEAVVSEIDRWKLSRCFEDHPRLAMIFFIFGQNERLLLMHRLTSMGRPSASQRIRLVLRMFHDRVGKNDPRSGSTIDLPLTQTEIGDLAGLSQVHVNRTLQALENQGQIRRSGVGGRTITFLEEDRLWTDADRLVRPQLNALDWLPRPR